MLVIVFGYTIGAYQFISRIPCRQKMVDYYCYPICENSLFCIVDFLPSNNYQSVVFHLQMFALICMPHLATTMHGSFTGELIIVRQNSAGRKIEPRLIIAAMLSHRRYVLVFSICDCDI